MAINSASCMAAGGHAEAWGKGGPEQQVPDPCWARSRPHGKVFSQDRGLVSAKLPHARPSAGGSSTVATWTHKLDLDNVADSEVQCAECLEVTEPALKLPRLLARILLLSVLQKPLA